MTLKRRDVQGLNAKCAMWQTCTSNMRPNTGLPFTRRALFGGLLALRRGLPLRRAEQIVGRIQHHPSEPPRHLRMGRQKLPDRSRRLG